MAEFSFLVTPYHGFEEEILRLRNRNRENSQDLAYLKWRYLGQESGSLPEIFWIKTVEGAFIGMAALIYRPYWFNGKKYECMVFGDISLDSEFRGTGLADKFFLFINEQLRKRKSPCALVIPNTAAARVFRRCGWQEMDRFVHYVFLLHPGEKLFEIVKSRILSNILNFFYSFFLKTKLSIIRTSNLSLSIVSEFSGDFDVFWNDYDKKAQCLRDKSRKSLQWRYGDYPGDERFFTARCHFQERFIAYLIYTVDPETKVLTVYELVTLKNSILSGFIKLFINYVQKEALADSIRVILNGKHLYCRYLDKAGFLARKGGQVIQIFIPDNTEVVVDGRQCALTAGDKDV